MGAVDEMTEVPAYAVDMLAEAAMADPYPHYDAIREAGPVVWLPHQEMYATARYETVQSILRNPDRFCSSRGVGFDRESNAQTGNLIQTDPPEHTHIRKIVGAPLSPSRVKPLGPRIEELADGLIDELVARRRFDAVSELAHYLPLTVVRELVGLPDEGRETLFSYGMALGILLSGDKGALAGRDAVMAQRKRIIDSATRQRVKPGGWIDGLWQACDAGQITADQVSLLMRDYIGPALHTTIMATTATIWLLARHPDQWRKLRRDPALIPNAVNEALRLEPPIHGFTRVATADADVGGVVLPSGSRIWSLYAAANRDPRKWDDQLAFDIERKNTDHLGFGQGIHMCAGMNLARLEIHALLKALVTKVESIELVGDALSVTGNIRRVEALPVEVRAA